MLKKSIVKIKDTIKREDLAGVSVSAYERRWKILATMCASLLLVSIGNSSMNQILPTLAKGLNLSSLQLTWIVDIYPLLFAGLLFTSSAVADRYGRKLVMQTGLVIFLISTLYAALVANSGPELILTRAVMGIAASMIMPTTLSIIENVFPKSERAKAIAIWSGVAGGGIALGSIATGFLIEHYDWNSVFMFSALVGVIALTLNQALTPESRDEKQTPVDWMSGVLSAIGLLGLIYGIIEAPTHGVQSGWVMASLITGIVSIGLFILRQLRLKHPMLDMHLFKVPAFSVAALSVTLAFFALMGIFFSMSQLFQLVMGMGPMESSLRMLPIMLLMMLTAPFVPSIVKKFGARRTVSTGLACMAVAFLLMSQWPTIPAYWQILGSMAIMMTGMSLTMTPSTNMLMSAIPRNRAGMGSAMNDTTRELGGAIGIAVLGSVLSSVYSKEITASVTDLPVQAQEAATNSLAGALAVGEKIGPAGTMLIDSAKISWMNGLSRSMVIAAVIVAAASIVAWLWLPKKHREGQDDEQLQPAIRG